MSKLTLPRRVTQIAFLLLTGEWLAIGWLRCPYGVPFVSCMSCPLRACPGTWLQPYFLALLGVSSLIVGRAFCGWGCPMGLIEEAMGRLTSPRLERFAGFVKADRWMKWLKWPALALVVYLIFALNYPADRAHAYVVRSTSAFDLASVKVAWSMGVSSYAIRAAVLGVALIGALVVMRAWCRYLCPLGATLGLLGKLSLVKLRRDETRCRSCGQYPRDCIHNTMPGTTDCVICGDCLMGCPADAVSFRLGKSTRGPASRPAEQEAERPAAG